MVEAEQTGQIILCHSAILQWMFVLLLWPESPCCIRSTVHTRAHPHSCTCAKWQSLLQDACSWGRARYTLSSRESARNNDDRC